MYNFEWNDVKDCIPSRDQYVLVAIDDRIPFIAKYSLKTKEWYCDYNELNNFTNFNSYYESVKFEVAKWAKIDNLEFKNIKNELPKNNSYIILSIENRSPMLVRYNENSKTFYLDLVIGEDDDEDTLYCEILVSKLENLNVSFAYIPENKIQNVNKGSVELIKYENNKLERNKTWEYEITHQNGETILVKNLKIISDKFGSFKVEIPFNDLPKMETKEKTVEKIANWLERLSISLKVGLKNDVFKD